MDRYLVTGSAGHLGEALVRTLRDAGNDVVGLDVLDSPFTTVVGSVTDLDTVALAMAGVRYVLHTATLHKPHVGSHSPQAFVDTNITGTLTVLDAASTAGVDGIVFTSSTSAFGRALTPPPGAPAAWITEDVPPVVRNIYGATKTAAEDLCELAHREDGLPVIVLRTSRFFPEGDDRDEVRATYPDLNVKINEFLYRRVDIADVVTAHLAAARRAADLGFGRYVVTATTPFTQDDLAELATDAPAVVARLFPDQPAVYDRLGWRMFPALDRVYVNARARTDLGWTPRHDFATALAHVAAGEDPRSPLAATIGAKGYHARPTGPYTA
ncbi:MAG TPA: NAD(P)-dependent oxidoreductase [Pseudonocardiaceae bacterium]|nr:NAD(P)-dependent oxidoreductase [Pseudonocardiaceae bacterium]